jgi:hypothetical protein
VTTAGTRYNRHLTLNVTKVFQILPVAVRNLLDKSVRVAIIKMSRVFQRLCAKEVRREDKERTMVDVVMATCILEKEFPPTFMNVMTHLPVHLVEQLFTCGPVHCRWMYPIERYLKTLKDYVRTYSHPEGSIAEGYLMDDTLGFCTEYMHQYRGTTHRVWDAEEDAIMNDEILRRNSQQKRKMSDEFRNYAHAFVLENASSLEQCRELVKSILSHLPAVNDVCCRPMQCPVTCPHGHASVREVVLDTVFQLTSFLTFTRQT